MNSIAFPDRWVAQTVAPDTRFSTYVRWESRSRAELEEFYEFYTEALSDVGAEWSVVTDHYNEDVGVGAVEIDFTMSLAQVFAWPTEFEVAEIADSIAVDLNVEDDTEVVVALTGRIFELREEHWLDRIRESSPARAVQHLAFAWSLGYLSNDHLPDVRESLDGRLSREQLLPLLEAEDRALRLFGQTLLDRTRRR